MKVRDVMTGRVIRIDPEENVEVAARTLAQYNIGALPVCKANGELCGMVTDRDLVTRCLATNKVPGQTKVREIMTSHIVSVRPDTDAGTAAHLMGQRQIRRLAVTENGKLCGMVTLGDLAAREDSVMDAADALQNISGNITEGRSW